MHTDHPPTHKRAIILVVILAIVLVCLIGWMAYYSYTVVANAVPF